MGTEDELKDLRAAQDAVMEGYVAEYNLTEKEVDDLHMFFSPTRVPIGLTYTEVRIVLLLFPLRDTERQKKFESQLRHPTLEGVVTAIALPDELIPDGQMTRLLFKTGIWKLLEQAACRERLN